MKQLGLFQRSYTAIAEELLQESLQATNGNGHYAPAEPSSGSGQVALFDKGEWWHEHWKGMPEFVQEDLAPVKTIYVHFESKEDYQAFSELVGQRLTMNTRSIWYPEAEIGRTFNKRYIDEPPSDEISEDIEVMD